MGTFPYGIPVLSLQGLPGATSSISPSGTTVGDIPSSGELNKMDVLYLPKKEGPLRQVSASSRSSAKGSISQHKLSNPNLMP